MNLPTLDVSVESAKAGVDEYRRALQHERNAEDEAIAAAYRAAARGFPLISLPAAIAAGGFFDNALPRMAITRADAKQCWVQWDRDWRRGAGDDVLIYTDQARQWGRGALVGEHVVTVHTPRPEGHRLPPGGQTVVPTVPPRHRVRGWQNMHILWEVEQWDPTPPRDPALLRHIRGELWAVIATWDLTDVERMVLAQRTAAGQ